MTIRKIFAAFIIAQTACNLDDKPGLKIQEQNMLTAKIYFEQYTNHDFKKIADLCSDTFEFKDPYSGQGIAKQNRLQTMAKHKKLPELTPGMRGDVMHQNSSNDNYIIVKFVSSGSAPDGTKWKFSLCTIFTIENGKIIKGYTSFDNWHNAIQQRARGF